MFRALQRHPRKIENTKEGVLLSYQHFHRDLKVVLFRPCLLDPTATALDEVSYLFIVRETEEYV